MTPELTGVARKFPGIKNNKFIREQVPAVSPRKEREWILLPTRRFLLLYLTGLLISDNQHGAAPDNRS